ncbi:MAG TPA: hypothetical protein ENK19_11865 [Acidobacteria bacterium]|nr:hypothetical protein [Acidobacteriota bacterium]
MTEPRAIERMEPAELVELARRIAGALERVGVAMPTGPGSQPEQPAESFRTLRAVVRYLQSQGWKIGERTIYKHRDQGKIVRDEHGRYPKQAVDNYAAAHLDRLAPGEDKADEIAALQKAKLRAEKEKTEAQARHWELRNKIESGYYVKRSEVESALAARAQVLRSGYENFVHAEAEQVVKLVDGDPERTADLIAYLLEAGEEWFHQYSEDREFIAVLTGQAAAGADES